MRPSDISLPPCHHRGPFETGPFVVPVVIEVYPRDRDVTSVADQMNELGPRIECRQLRDDVEIDRGLVAEPNLAGSFEVKAIDEPHHIDELRPLECHRPTAQLFGPYAHVGPAIARRHDR